MKITQFRRNGDATALSVMDLEKLVNKVKTEIKSRPVSIFREGLKYMLPDDRCMFADKLPEIIPAAEFRKVNGQKQMKAYNGIVELTVGPLSNKSTADPLCFYGFEWKNGEDMDHLYPSG